MNDETPADETDPALLALENRRLNRRRRRVEPSDIDTPETTTNDHPRLARQLSETPQPREDLTEHPSRTIRWRLPGKLLTVLTLLLLLTTAYQLFTSKNSTTLDTVETGNETSSTPLTQENTETTNPPHQKTATVWVHVAGAVVSPGIYELSSIARIADAVTAAGGARDDADLNHVNLAAHITDGSQIYIPATGEQPPTAPPPPTAQGTAKPNPQTPGQQLINLNTADRTELETLPRVGPVLAQKIIEWREANGGFTSVAELDAVPGIGPAMMETLTPLVTV